ncbi:MAG TPA: DUF4266 domain-containing protein [Verrucomicrobiae bacterium]
MSFPKRKLYFATSLAALAFATGCANVKPWQRGTLADEAMRPERGAANTALAEHMWFSREAAAGGRGVGGGGCGCN